MSLIIKLALGIIEGGLEGCNSVVEHLHSMLEVCGSILNITYTHRHARMCAHVHKHTHTHACAHAHSSAQAITEDPEEICRFLKGL